MAKAKNTRMKTKRAAMRRKKERGYGLVWSTPQTNKATDFEGQLIVPLGHLIEEDGYELPLHAVCMDRKGHLFAMRCSETVDGNVEARPLTEQLIERADFGAFTLPIYGMVVDNRGEAARLMPSPVTEAEREMADREAEAPQPARFLDAEARPPKRVVKIDSVCEHGGRSVMDLPLPLTVEILDCSEDESGSEFVVWLMSKTPEGKEWYVATVTEPTHCSVHAELVATAFKALLATENGQAAAVEYIRHEFSDGDGNETADHIH